MDELQMRRRLIAAPKEIDDELRAALEQNPGTDKLRQSALQFDQQLQFGLQQAVIPEGLNDRILLNTDLKQRSSKRLRWISGLALAASILVSTSLSLRTTDQVQPASDTTRGFQELALAHVHDEIHHLEHPPGQVSNQRVQHLFAEYGGELSGDIGEVQMAYRCPTPAGEALHLVVDSAEGRATLLYWPQADEQTKAIAFADHRFRGVTLLPQSGGVLALLAEDQQAVDSLLAKLDQNLRWSSRSALSLRNQHSA